MGALSANIFYGWIIAMIGPLGILVLQLGWFANIAFAAALGLVMSPLPRDAWKGRAQRNIAFVALLLLCLNASTWTRMYGDNGSAVIKGSGQAITCGSLR